MRLRFPLLRSAARPPDQAATIVANRPTSISCLPMAPGQARQLRSKVLKMQLASIRVDSTISTPTSPARHLCKAPASLPLARATAATVLRPTTLRTRQRALRQLLLTDARQTIGGSRTSTASCKAIRRRGQTALATGAWASAAEAHGRRCRHSRCPVTVSVVPLARCRKVCP